MSNSYPENEIKSINEILHKLLGKKSININGNLVPGEDIIGRIDQNNKNCAIYYTEEETLTLLRNICDKKYLDLYTILNFYYPRWIAYNSIRESDDEFSEYSSNNELLLALTSIIDKIANNNKQKMGWTKRFSCFLSLYLAPEDINEIIKNFSVYKKDGVGHIQNLEDFAQYIYEVRSYVVHGAELGGIYPYNIAFKTDNGGGFRNIVAMIAPSTFRRLLWKAILKSLELDIIY